MRTRALRLSLLAAAAALAAVWQPWPPDAVDLLARHAPPSFAHPLGTDQLGRDLLARVWAGLPRTVGAVAVVATMCLALGLGVGLAASAADGAARAGLLRAAEFAAALPALVVAIAVVAVLGLDVATAGLALGLCAWGPHALLAFGLAERCRRETYVRAASALGGGAAHVMLRHVLPAVIEAQLAYLGAKLGRFAVSYASLAFLGLGADMSRPDWGAMLYEYRYFMFDDPALMLWPGLALVTLCVVLRSVVVPAAAKMPQSGAE
jgi:peptide/nickel transport system permease protein